jgi:type II secretory pathway pseudopilin PulG
VKKNQWAWLRLAVLGGLMAAALPLWTQTQGPSPSTAPAAGTTPGAYQPKFAGDPARSESEAQALGYMRVVLRAQREYKKRHNKYAESLPALAGTGSLTKRMARSPERGDYTASFRTQKDGFILTMTPKQVDAEHRSFYAEEDGIIHADDQKAADQNSPRIK